jgi:hypothetical protein
MSLNPCRYCVLRSILWKTNRKSHIYRNFSKKNIHGTNVMSTFMLLFLSFIYLLY